jgi:PAS domain S-box-containing protein
MSFADRQGTIGTSVYWLHTWPRRYGFALIAVAVATLLRYPLNKLLGGNLPFILFFPVIWLVAWMAGRGPGVFAVFLSGAAASYLFSGPINRSALGLPINANGLLLFSIAGVTLSGVVDVHRRRAERLREFERATAGVEEGIIVLDRQYRYVVANRVFLGYRGVKKEELIGRTLAETMGASVFETTVKPKLDECFRGQVVRFEKRYNYAAIGERDFSVAYFPIEGPSRVERVVCILQDITEQKEAERSLKLFRTLIDHSNDAVEVVDPETLRFLDVNEKACNDLGYTREELLGMTVFDIDPNADEPCRRAVLDGLRDSGFVMKQSVHHRKDGSSFPVESSLKLVRLDRDYIVTVSRDISDRKRAEEALRSSEDQYRDLVDHSEDLVCTHDLEGRLLSANPAPARLLGYEVDELLKIPMRELMVPEYRELFDGYLRRIKENGADKGLMCVIARNGEVRTWEYNNTLRTEGVDKPIVRGMAHDVTEKRRAELGLQASEQRYRLLFEKNLAGVATASWDGEVLDCNDAWARILGYDRAEEVRGRRVSEFYYRIADREPMLEALKREGPFLSREMQLRRKDDSLVWVLFNAAALDDGEGHLVVQATAIDISERKRVEEALQRSETHFRFLVEQASDGIFITDPQGKYVDVNSAGAEMLGYTREDLLQLSIPDIVMAGEVPRVGPEVGRFEGGATVLSEWKFRRKDGSSFPGEVCGKQLPDGRLQGILRDISERRDAEDAMRRSEERFRVALKDSPITVFNQDRELRYTWIYNPQLYWQHEAIGRTDAEIIGSKKAASLVELKRRVLKEGVGLREDVVIPNGGENYAFDIWI